LARIIAVLRALGDVYWRELKSFESLTGQNFFLLVALIALQPESAAFFGLVLGALLLFPLSSDPIEKIPRERRKLWPLSRTEWAAIRAASIALSPVMWIAIYLLVKVGWRMGVEFAIVAFAIRIGMHVARLGKPKANPLRWLPAPPGVIGQIMRLHWREMLMTLDPYVALLISAATAAYRLSGAALDRAALPVLSMIVVVALSTTTQVLIGLDGAGALRYHLFPIRGWQVLLGKDLAFLTILLLLVAPIEIPASLLGGVAALAVGHHRSAMPAIAQHRWRFTSGVLWPTGAGQIFAIFAIGNGFQRFGWWFGGLTIVAWVFSILWFGRKVVSG
jgi:hypothetical protein